MSSGHNSGAPRAPQSGGVAAGRLRAFIERIERLEEEKKTVSDDIREVYAEAKANGFDAKVMRQVVKLRKQDAAERQEQEAILDLYMHALGMLPLFDDGEDADVAPAADAASEDASSDEAPVWPRGSAKTAQRASDVDHG